MRVLGIHEGHNASACLLENGRIEHCIQEERPTNTKNYWGFPAQSIAKILELSGLGPGDVDHVALAGLHVGKACDVLRTYRKQTSPIRSKVLEALMKTPLYGIHKALVRRKRLARIIEVGLPIERTTFVEHHLCHAATAYYGCPWRDEKVLVLTNDGSGDGLCATVSTGENGTISRIAKTPKGNSIGNIYARVTFMLGLTPWEHEWKIMGMAPYAPENGMDKSYEVFKRYLSVPESALSFKRDIPEPTYLIYQRLRRDLEFHRFDWIAAGVQKMSEELLAKWARNAVRHTGIHKLALAGGVFMNVKANKRILELDEIDELFVFPSCGDESLSIGAAYQTYSEERRKQGGDVAIAPLGPIYFGPDIEEREVLEAIEQTKGSYKVERFDDIDAKVAELLADGQIVARCKERMEFGARALGNRSILADASNYGCVREINMMVKKRDFWMPFAPAMLPERASDYVVNPKNATCPYMILSLDSTDKRDEYIAAVHQADLTARPQIIQEGWNPGYYRVLKEFEKRTGKGVILNTSFNLHGYPLVYGPQEALSVLDKSGLRYLALGNWLLSK